ncbi:restriction endonuclease subunit S [Campylobacter porcelli]|uniref:Type I restriction/modification system, S subunit n=1 Tax=Campylobacter porcelli TaxID=1660073 RepID=A0A1X9SV41_9BACT|nr:restriction endonuclease subunit S [Campylobacter sp. RM6137]ARQ99988.1 type I restriction/modification system, S subunit [Campylobacter sp. RM6137]
MSKLDELIEKLCPNGVNFEELRNKELFKFYYGKGNKIPEDIGGIYDVYGANGVVSHINEYNCEDVTIIGHIGAVGMVNRCKGKCFVTYNGTIAEVVDKSKVNSQYLYYVLTTLNLPSYKKGSQPFLSVSDFDKIRIPVPPLEVQCEIVRILDNFTLLSAELSARKKQYQYYLDSIYENIKDNNVNLGSIGSFTRGKRFVHADVVDEGVPCIHYGELYTFYGVHVNKVKSHIKEELRSKMRYANKNDVIIVGAGENRMDIGIGVAWEGDEDVAVHDACYTLKHNQNPKYISYFLRTSQYHNQIKKFVYEGKICSISAEGLKKAIIPIPSIEEQNKIVNILEKFDDLCNDISQGLPAEIEARQKQYEYYRDKLLAFKELKVDE